MRFSHYILPLLFTFLTIAAALGQDDSIIEDEKTPSEEIIPEEDVSDQETIFDDTSEEESIVPDSSSSEAGIENIESLDSESAILDYDDPLFNLSNEDSVGKKKKKKEKEIFYYKELGKIYRSPIRKILNMFSVNLSSGLGFTRYKQDLKGLLVYQNNTQNQLFVNGRDVVPEGGVQSGFSNWLNQPSPVETATSENQFPIPAPFLENPINNPLLGDETMVFDADQLGLQYRSLAYGIPILASIHFNYRDFRLGVGIEYEFHKLRRFAPNVNEDLIASYKPNVNMVIYNRKFIYAGYKFYDYWNYSFAGEVTLGKFKAPASRFNESLIERSIFWSLGLSVEKNISEYFRLVMKPSLEFKNYTLNLPNGSAQINTKYPTLMFNVGVSYNFPEIPRSPVPGDRTQLKHVITDRLRGRRAEVRGQPFYKEQNPKMGQNHRKLIKYKGKNKRKLNPY